MQFRAHSTEQPAFPWWDACAVRVGCIMQPLVSITPEDMDGLLGDPQSWFGIPTMIARRDAEEFVRIYPIPDQDFDVVPVPDALCFPDEGV